MTSTENYTTADGEPVPSAVAAAFDAPGEWPAHNRIAPDAVAVVSTFIGPVFEGFVDGERRRVTDGGDVDHPTDYEHLAPVDRGELPRFDYDAYVTYRDDIDHAHVDHFHDPEISVTVHGRGGSLTVHSHAGALWSHYPDQDGDVTPEMVRLAVALSGVNSGIDAPDGVVRVLSGWHSSMEPSDQSDMMNGLIRGDIPPEVDAGVAYPYAVKTAPTRNIATTGKSVYASEAFGEIIRDYFDDAQAKPNFAGFS